MSLLLKRDYNKYDGSSDPFRGALCLFIHAETHPHQSSREDVSSLASFIDVTTSNYFVEDADFMTRAS